MDKNVFHQLEKRLKEIEENYGSLENFVVQTTIWGDQHRMRMEEQNSSVYDEMKQVYQELSDLELADLLDFQKKLGEENGEFS